jgi:hypothetical protein
VQLWPLPVLLPILQPQPHCRRPPVSVNVPTIANKRQHAHKQ